MIIQLIQKDMSQIEAGVKNEANPREVAQMQAERVKMDFGHLDQRALREANEQPAVADYVKDLQTKLEWTQQLLQELKQSVMAGEYETDSINAKIKFADVMDRARTTAHHALTKPEHPDRVSAAQAGLDRAGEKFQQGFLKPAETMWQALDGKQSDHETYPGEMAEKYNVGNIRENLTAEQLVALQTEVLSTLRKLQELRPEVENIARQKALKPEEKDSVLKNYETMYDLYAKVNDELKQVLSDVEKAQKR